MTKQDAVVLLRDPVSFFLLVAVIIVGSAIYERFEQGQQADAANLSQSAFELGRNAR